MRAGRPVVLLWACAALQPAWSQTATPQAPAVIKSETKLVIVDVVVTDKKGAYIHDLAAKNFHVWEDNKEQTIQSVTLQSAAAGRVATPSTDYLVMLFDYGGMDGADQLRARQAGARFIDANAGPNRKMAVANYDAGLRIARGFTENAGRLKDAVAGAAVAANNTKAGTSASTDLGAGDRFLALKSLASELHSVPGRKTIVLFTGSLIARSDQKGPLAAAIEACNRANVAVYPVDVRDTSRPSGPAIDNDEPSDTPRGRGQFGALVLPGSPLPDPRYSSPVLKGDADPAATADPGGASQQILFALADGTGGFVIRNAGEMLSGLQKIGQEQEEYYLLGYTPASSKEGACHTLKVKVDRSGAALRARSSYCNGKPDDLVTGKPAEKNLEARAAAAQTGNIAASMRLPFFYVAPGVASVHVTMEIQPEAIKFEKKGAKLHADVSVLGIASTAEGATASRFGDTLSLDFDEADQTWKQKPVHYEQQLKIASGQYTFTVVFSAGGESFGKLSQPLVVEPYQPGQFAMSSIALSKEIRKGGAAAPLASLFDERTTLTVGGIEMIPTGSNAFTKTEQGFCYLEVYLPAGDAASSLTVRLRILSPKAGDPIWDGGAVKVDVPTGKLAIPVGMSVPIAGLAPGSYQLEVTANDGAGHTVLRASSFVIE